MATDISNLQEDQVRLIFGLKLRQARTDKGLSLFGLSKLTGLSKSYLNEIEKGKKYPKPDKIVSLSKALEVPYDELVSMKLKGRMAPVSQIILSGILKELPLEIFGIDEQQLLDIISNAPEKVTSFIGTLFEVARHYGIDKNQFYLNALRSYQEQRFNHFAEIEDAVRDFSKKHQLVRGRNLSSQELQELLEGEYEYTVDYQKLNDSELPEDIRSLYIPKSKKLLIASNVTEAQRTFILGKELGYAHMQIAERPLTFTWIRFERFDEVLNNFRASYFAGALMIPEKPLVDSIKQIFDNPEASPESLLHLINSYSQSAETFFQRLTNVLPVHFGLNDMFFLRFGTKENHEGPVITKEFHLSKSHQPHANHEHEHYCSRWVSTDLLNHPERYPMKDGIRAGAQVSIYPNGDSYLILAASNEDPFQTGTTRSVCIGIELNTKQKKRFAFLDHVANVRQVGTTCERCPIDDCKVRKAPPRIAQQEEHNEAIEKKIENLLKTAID